MSMLRVSEIFHSIQGEGSRAGLPCVFVRLHGCGLRCVWCDTPYALDHRSGGEEMDVEHILHRVAVWNCDFVEVTGGEPLEQEGSFDLLTRLCDAEYTVAVETGGHVDISRVDSRVIVIMDLKAPGSGMAKRNRFGNLDYLKSGDEVKFVLASREDYEWARATVREHALTERCGVLFSPVFSTLAPRDLAQWVLEDGLRLRMQLQMHKFIWDPDARGV